MGETIKNSSPYLPNSPTSSLVLSQPPKVTYTQGLPASLGAISITCQSGSISFNGPSSYIRYSLGLSGQNKSICFFNACRVSSTASYLRVMLIMVLSPLEDLSLLYYYKRRKLLMPLRQTSVDSVTGLFVEPLPSSAIPLIRQWRLISERRFGYRFHRCPILFWEVFDGSHS